MDCHLVSNNLELKPEQGWHFPTFQEVTQHYFTQILFKI